MKKNFYQIILILLLTSSNLFSQKWEPVNVGLPYSPIQFITMTDNKIFTIRLNSYNIFESTDNGNSWLLDTNQLGDYTQVYSLVINNTDIYALTDWGLYKSSDKGSYWERFNSDSTNIYVNCLLIEGSNFYEGVSGGVIRSTDNGKTWMKIDSGLPHTNGSFAEIYIRSLILNDSNIFATVWTTRGPHYKFVGLYRCKNLDTVWEEIPFLFPQVLSMAANKSDIFIGTSNGLFRSTDGGNSWFKDSVYIPSDASIQDINLKNNIFVGTAKGLYQSIDNGKTWVRDSIGISPNVKVNSIYVNGNLVLVGTEINGIYKSTDNGFSWEQLNQSLPALGGCWSLTANDSSIFSGYLDLGIYKSTDNGNNWEQSMNGFPDDIYVKYIEANGKNIFASNNNNGLYKSFDDGNSWVMDTSAYFFHKAIFPILTKDNFIFVGAALGICISSDNGSTWVKDTINKVLAKSGILSFAKNDNFIFVGTDMNGIFRSSDYGNSWVQLSNGIENSWIILSLTTNGSKIYSSLVNNSSLNDQFSIYESTDNGDNWKLISNNLPNTYINCLKTVNNNIYAGFNKYGVYYSYNDGLNWENNLDGIPEGANINCFLSKDNYLFAGTDDYGIYRLDLTTLNIQNQQILNQTTKISPNPSSDFIEINVGVQNFEPLQKNICIYNVLGEIVLNSAPALSASREEVRINVSGLPTGVYFLKVGNKVGKFVKI